jgi:ABC-type transport system involved in multi-copper enzyme maturation permease subunit
MTATQKASKANPSWFKRFWAIVRYEMLWNIRKKKFIGVIVIAFVLATLGLVLPSVLSSTTGTAITANPNFAITYGASSFGFFLFALATAMNSISSEFESGTIVPLVTKPVSRTMIFLGKLFAAFIIILISYVILFTYTTVGSIFVYGPQNNLELVPLVLLGNLISTFIWVSLLLAVGSLTKNTIITVMVAVGLFLALFIAIPIVSVFAGPSSSLNYLPGSGAGGSMLVGNTTMSISTGTDNLGVNLANYVLYPSANVTFSKLDLSAIQAGQTTLPTTGVLYTESMPLIALRALGIAFAYIFVFLFIAWIALKRSQILE